MDNGDVIARGQDRVVVVDVLLSIGQNVLIDVVDMRVLTVHRACSGEKEEMNQSDVEE